jgi:hypothetical protein
MYWLDVLLGFSIDQQNLVGNGPAMGARGQVIGYRPAFPPDGIRLEDVQFKCVVVYVFHSAF